MKQVLRLSKTRVPERPDSAAKGGSPAVRTAAAGAASSRFAGMALLLLIRGYQLLLSPFLGGACRFVPSCSHYMAEAVDLHGPARGAWLGLRRLARCHPLCEGGHDPVPAASPDSHFSARSAVARSEADR